jgi:hypothetical protein
MITVKERNELLKEFILYQQQTKREISYQDYIEECLIADRIRVKQYSKIIRSNELKNIENKKVVKELPF